MNKKIVVAILLLCAALSMGCLEEEEQTYVQEVVEEPEINETILEPAKLVIKSIKADDEGIVFKIKNEGQLPAEDIYFAMIGIDYHPVYDENLRWHHNISDEECDELINGVIRNNDFKLNTFDYGRTTIKRIDGENINVSGEPLHLVPLLYKDYIDVINSGEMIESNMYVYWDHDRYIKVLYDGSYNIYEYTLYDKGNYDVGGGNFKSIIS